MKIINILNKIVNLKIRESYALYVLMVSWSIKYHSTHRLFFPMATIFGSRNQKKFIYKYCWGTRK